MPAKRLVIFDLDNTLVANRTAAKAAYEAAIRFLSKEAGLEFDKLYGHWKKIVQTLTSESAPEKRSFEFSVNSLCQKHNISNKLVPLTVHMFEKELLQNLKPTAGAKELLSWLKEQHALVAVSAGTDRSLAKKKLKATQLNQYVDCLITASDVGQMKPEANYFHLILQELNVNTDQSLVISDSKTEDLDIAKKLGFKTIKIPVQNVQLTALKPELSEFLSFSV